MAGADKIFMTKLLISIAYGTNNHSHLQKTYTVTKVLQMVNIDIERHRQTRNFNNVNIFFHENYKRKIFYADKNFIAFCPAFPHIAADPH